jgi:hypothetical protein
MDKMNLQYAAGMFDADGSVTISKRVEERKLGTYTRYQVRVSLLSITPTVPQLYAHTFSGKVYYEDKSIKHPSWRPVYTWIAVSRVASAFLRKVHPFLINKQEEAEAALALEDSIARYKYNLRCEPDRANVLAYRESLRKKITDLKKRSYPLLDTAPNQLRV